MSGNGNNVTQATTLNEPLYQNSIAQLSNFNPVISFPTSGLNATANLSAVNGMLGTGTYTAANAFIMARTDQYTGNGSSVFWENLNGAGSSNRLNLHAPYNDANVDSGTGQGLKA